MKRIVLENEEAVDGKEEIYVAEDLNFKPKPQCKHHFRRTSAKNVECTHCHIGFIDDGDFPVNEMNEFYKK